MAAPGSRGCLTHVPQNIPVYALAFMQGLHMCRKVRESMALFTIHAYQPGASLCVCHSLSQRQHTVFPKEQELCLYLLGGEWRGLPSHPVPAGIILALTSVQQQCHGRSCRGCPGDRVTELSSSAPARSPESQAPSTSACAPGGPDSHLTPPRCEVNKFLTRTCGARRGCVSGAADQQVLVEASRAGWQAARLPWPPATTPASRRAGLPDTSLPCVTGHWVVSRTRKELRRLLGTGRPP